MVFKGVMCVIDSDGFRPNVGIILANKLGQILWARRIRQNSWQFPQGGILDDETPEQAMYRELYEEIGLLPKDVDFLGCSPEWLRYRLPKRLIRKGQQPLCVGQKQKWFLLSLLSRDDCVRLDHTSSPEFSDWRWVSYWYPLGQVVSFKREVYRAVLEDFVTKIFSFQVHDS